MIFSFAIVQIGNWLQNYFISELGHKVRGRPEKRVGGGGYGNNRDMTNDMKKARKFKPVNRQDSKKSKFMR